MDLEHPNKGGARPMEPTANLVGFHANRDEVLALDELLGLSIRNHLPNVIRGASPLGLPYTLSRSPLRRLAPFAWLARDARSHLSANQSLRWLRLDL